MIRRFKLFEKIQVVNCYQYTSYFPKVNEKYAYIEYRNDAERLVCLEIDSAFRYTRHKYNNDIDKYKEQEVVERLEKLISNNSYENLRPLHLFLKYSKQKFSIKHAVSIEEIYEGFFLNENNKEFLLNMIENKVSQKL